MVSNARWNWAGPLTVTVWTCRPRRLAAASVSCTNSVVAGPVLDARKATPPAPGTASRNNSRRFPARSGLLLEIPAAGPRQAPNQSGTDRVRGHDHDGNRARGIPCRVSRTCRERDDDIDRPPHQLGRLLARVVVRAGRRTPLEHDVLPVGISELTKRVTKNRLLCGRGAPS